MGHMQAEMTDKQFWVSIDGNAGTDHIPADLIDLAAVRAIIDGPEATDYAEQVLALVRDYTENTKAYEASIVFGYGVRSSAPGYMDCTSWAVYTNKREATQAYNAEKRECNGQGD